MFLKNLKETWYFHLAVYAKKFICAVCNKIVVFTKAINILCLIEINPFAYFSQRMALINLSDKNKTCPNNNKTK